MNINSISMRLAIFMLSFSLNVYNTHAEPLSGTVTFADQDGKSNNDPLPSLVYTNGLPAGVTAQWSGWLLHTASHTTPMSVFPAHDLAGDDGKILFSQPVVIPSFSVLDTAHGSTFSVMGYRSGLKVWHYDGVDDAAWHTVTTGAGIEIDTLVAEGKWNHLDDITVEISDGTNGTISLASLSIADINTASNEIGLRWPGTPGATLQLQSADTLTSPDWDNESPEMFGVGGFHTYTASMGSPTSRFYRVNVVDMLPEDEISAEVGIALNGLPPPPAGYVWAPIPAYTDEFNGTSLDRSKWDNFHPYWSGRAPSEHLPANVSVADGKLRLKNSVIRDPSTVADPTTDVWVGAACIASVDPTASYGYYETKMKASAVCMTSAFWFQEGPPQPNGDSEIDVVEQLGVSYNNPYKEYYMQMNSHYYPGGWPNDIATPTHWTMPTRAREEYHVYGVWWKDANTLWMYHNGVKVAEMTPGGPFIDPQYMFFDTEVFRWEGLPTVANLNDDSKNTMYVDWVRGWQLVPE